MGIITCFLRTAFRYIRENLVRAISLVVFVVLRVQAHSMASVWLPLRRQCHIFYKLDNCAFGEGLSFHIYRDNTHTPPSFSHLELMCLRFRLPTSCIQMVGTQTLCYKRYNTNNNCVWFNFIHYPLLKKWSQNRLQFYPLSTIHFLHLWTFKTPTSWAVMSDKYDADWAFSMRNGVKKWSQNRLQFYPLSTIPFEKV